MPKMIYTAFLFASYAPMSRFMDVLNPFTDSCQEFSLKAIVNIDGSSVTHLITQKALHIPPLSALCALIFTLLSRSFRAVCVWSSSLRASFRYLCLCLCAMSSPPVRPLLDMGWVGVNALCRSFCLYTRRKRSRLRSDLF